MGVGLLRVQLHAQGGPHWSSETSRLSRYYVALGRRQCSFSRCYSGYRPCDRRDRFSIVVRVSAEDTVEVETVGTEAPAKDTNFVPVMRPEDLPKGARKEVRVQGISILLFWYRNQILGIESRSPAEGAYSEGFLNAKLTQDYCIECPTTKSLFSLKTGEVVSWYPGNPVLRALTPKDLCPDLKIFPIKLTQEAIFVDLSGLEQEAVGIPTRGGADSSLERNNVYALQPRVYVEGSQESGQEEAGPGAGPLTAPVQKLDPYVLAISIFAVAAVAVTGTAVCIYFESFVGLGIFWVTLFALVAASTFQYVKTDG